MINTHPNEERGEQSTNRKGRSGRCRIINEKKTSSFCFKESLVKSQLPPNGAVRAIKIPQNTCSSGIADMVQ
jgi:hypothetical protein